MDSLTLPLRVLVVAPRPKDLALPSYELLESFYDALEAQGEQIEAEYLWPATLEALSRRIEARERPAVGLLYLETIAAEDGESLYLEDERAEGQLVTWGQLGKALHDRGIRAVLLGSAGGTAQAFAANLAKASGAHIILCDYDRSSTAQDTGHIWTAFLSGILSGHALSQALPQGLSFYPAGEDLPLIASTSRQAKGIGKIVRFPGAELTPPWKRLALYPEAGGLPPEPEQGFVGRSRELSALERALRSEGRSGIVLVHGYEGVGKTALVAHAARWLVRTGRFAQVVYTDFAGGGHVDSALYDLGQRLLGAEFSPDQEKAEELVEHALEETPTLVIWDGLEVLLPEGEMPLGAAALDELLKFGARVARSGKSNLCVISENPSLPDPAYTKEALALSLALEGLDPSDALALFSKALSSLGAKSPPPDGAAELVEALGGHPLALNVLAPLCVEQPLEEVMAQLRAILPGLDAGEARLRNQGLAAALEALLRSLGDDLGRKTLAFGLFVGGFMEPLALRIVQLDERSWEVIKKRLSTAQLLRDVRLQGLNVPFVAVYPALTKHLSRRLSALQHKELEQRYYANYFALMTWAMQSGSVLPAVLRPLMRCELPNLRRGVRVLMAAQELEMLGDYAHFLQNVLDRLGLKKEREAIANEVEAAILNVVGAEGPLSRAAVRFLLSRCERLFAIGRVLELGKMLEELLGRMEREDGLAYGGDEAILDRGIALHWFARCWQATGNLEQAASYYERAAGLLGGLVANSEARREFMMLQANQGDMFLASRQLDKAWDAYRRGLAIAEEFGDRYRMGKISAQLGAIAFAWEQLEQAKQLCEAALEHLKDSEDYGGKAAVWNQLAAIAWRASDLAEAKRCYEQALALVKQIGNALLEAQIWMQLAQVAEQADQPHEAEADYVQALRIYQQRNIKPAVVATEMALAKLLLDRGQLQNARIHAEAARAAAESSSPDAHPWQVYALLQRIAEAEKDEERVAYWRSRAQESFAASPESKMVLRQWRPIILGVARACRGEALSSDTVELLEKLEANAQWQQLTERIWRILSGERDPQLYAELDYVDALIIRRLLAAIESPELEDESTQDEATEDEAQKSSEAPS